MAGLFDTFNVGKRGLSVNQSAINTTSHNIANANTVGYSRQRSVAETTRPFGGMSRFDTCSVGQVGTGAEITSIQRIRDSFIDYQVREETGKLGSYDVESKFLSQVEDVFGEPSDKGIQKLFSEFYATFHDAAISPDKSSPRTVALQKAQALADSLNHAYTQLENKVKDAQGLLQNNVNDVNSYLDQINELNQQISSVCAVGQTPNDLMDKRDNLLDQVSKMFGITVKRQAGEAIDLKADGFQDPSNTINNLVNHEPTNDKYTRFSYIDDVTVDDKTNNVTIKYYPLGDSKSATKTIEITGCTKEKAQTLKDNLEQNRILISNKDGVVSDDLGAEITTTTLDEINKKVFKIYEVSKDSTGKTINSVDIKNIKGEIAGNQSTQDMIKGYMKDLDRIAASLAYSVNAIQTGSTKTGNAAPDGQNYDMFFVNSDKSTDTTKTDDGISAKNITVNKDILDDVSKLNCSSKNTDGEKNGDRAQAIADLISKKINMSNLPDSRGLTRDNFFNNTTDSAGIKLDAAGVHIEGSKDGKTVDGYYNDIISALGTKAQEANRRAETERDTTLKELQMQKLSVSGVSIDEEMTNLIQFQHAYQANAKVISTVDELLDVVINGLKR